MLSSFTALVKNSFAEVIRQPIYGILLVMGMVMIGFSPVITMFTMMEDVKLTIDMGLGTIFMVGIVLAVLSATQVISKEVESKTAGAVLSKPVGRMTFVLGKFIGVSLAMWLASYLYTVMLLLTVRMGVPSTAAYTVDWPVLIGQVLPLVLAVLFGMHANYFYRWNFTATAVRSGAVLYTIAILGLLFVTKDWQFAWIAEGFVAENFEQIFLAAVLVGLGVWLISAVALVASTRLNVVPNVVVCLGVFFVGMVSQYFFGWTVDDQWVRWEPQQDSPEVEITGRVETEQGEPVEGVALTGAPMRPVTNEDGDYRAIVARGESGTITPDRTGLEFSPSERSYTDVVQDRRGQDFTAQKRDRDALFYLEKAWWWVARVGYHVVPSLQFFWVADQLMRPEPYIPLAYVGRTALYAVFWCGAMVALGAFLFEHREVI